MRLSILATVWVAALSLTGARENLPRVNHHLSAQFLPSQSRGEKVAATVYYPDDEFFLGSPQWALNNPGGAIGGVAGKAGADLGMTRVWDRFDGDDSLVIAVLDAGFNFNHPDLQGKWFRNTREIGKTTGVDDDLNGVIDDTAGWDFVDNDNSPQDYESHGTEVSGVIAAAFDNGVGIAGMIPRVKILPVRVLNTVGQGYTSTIAAGIRYAVKMHANVINFSIGGGANDTALRNAFQFARDSGVVIVAAAGNDSLNLDTHPAPPSSYGFDNVYMVAAHNHGGNLCSFSNYGATTVPITAPGQYILTTGIPSLVLSLRDTFELGTSNWTFATASDFALSSTTPLQGTKTLQWNATANTWAVTANNIDLTGQVGSSIWFLLNYKPANILDQLIVEGQTQGTTAWTQFALINGTVSTQWLSFDTHAMDGKLFKLRFRTSTTGVATGRIFRLDDVRVYHQGTTLDVGSAYPVTAGTSLSAPYMAGYIGLLKVACKRTGTTFSRSLVLAAAAAETGLTGKVSTGGRLDVSKGLNFYLSTLPRLIVSDSTKTSWTVGQQVAYALSVTPTPTAPAYTYSVLPARASGTSFICNPVSPCATTSVVSSMPGSTLSSTGAFAWNSTGGQVNTYVARFRADKSPLVLRKMMTFSLKAVVDIQGSVARSSETFLWIGERAFVLPRSFFQSSSHQLRVESIHADGRIEVVFSGNAETPVSSTRVAYQIPGLSGVDWRVWADGSQLQPLRR